jgi:PPOX class probable F420-dependent enzyme
MSVEIPASHRPVLEAPGTAVLTTVGPDGRPQSTAVWYLLEGDAVMMSLLANRQKVRNLRRNPKATLFAFDGNNQYKTIEIRGDAILQPDPERDFFSRIVRHYGHDPETFPDDRSADRVALTLTPSHVVANG